MLALFLLLSIVALIKSIQILSSLKRITNKAESIADKAEEVTEFFQDVKGPISLIKSLQHIVHAVQNSKRKGK
jgi:uncharacterized membrane protein